MDLVSYNKKLIRKRGFQDFFPLQVLRECLQQWDEDFIFYLVVYLYSNFVILLDFIDCEALFDWCL